MLHGCRVEFATGFAMTETYEQWFGVFTIIVLKSNRLAHTSSLENLDVVRFCPAHRILFSIFVLCLQCNRCGMSTQSTMSIVEEEESSFLAVSFLPNPSRS